MEFEEGISLETSKLTQMIGSVSYLPWATAVALSGRPPQEVVLFGGKPYLLFFGGAVVAIDQTVSEARRQRVWLPVMDANMAPVPAERLNARLIGDSLARARAKAVAMVNGVGLSLYAGYGGNAKAFIDALGITPQSNLAQVPPLTEKKGSAGTYVSWAAALAAARLTDPNFTWEVVMFESADWATGEISKIPALAIVDGGYMVAVKVRYLEQVHTEYLPIMGVKEVSTKRGPRKMDHQPLEKPTVFDWNRAIMRGLTKAIAVVSGYGLSVYAGEDIEALAEAAHKPEGAEAANPDAADNLVAELEALLPQDEERRARIFRACVARGLVKEVPTSAADLVAMSHEAAEQVLAGLKAKASAK